MTWYFWYVSQDRNRHWWSTVLHIVELQGKKRQWTDHSTLSHIYYFLMEAPDMYPYLAFWSVLPIKVWNKLAMDVIHQKRSEEGPMMSVRTFRARFQCTTKKLEWNTQEVNRLSHSPYFFIFKQFRRRAFTIHSMHGCFLQLARTIKSLYTMMNILVHFPAGPSLLSMKEETALKLSVSGPDLGTVLFGSWSECSSSLPFHEVSTVSCDTLAHSLN